MKRRTRGTAYFKGVSCGDTSQKPSRAQKHKQRHFNGKRKILKRATHRQYCTNLLAALQREVGQSTAGGVEEDDEEEEEQEIVEKR